MYWWVVNKNAIYQLWRVRRGGWVYLDYSVSSGPILRFSEILWDLSYSLRLFTIQYVRSGTRAWQLDFYASGSSILPSSLYFSTIQIIDVFLRLLYYLLHMYITYKNFSQFVLNFVFADLLDIYYIWINV